MAAPALKGLWKATVVDTSTFRENGTIRVRVLGVTPEDGYEEAYVMLPFGGHENMGIHFLPPIGSYGFVAYERGKATEAIWMGSIMRYWGKAMEDDVGSPVEAENETDFVIKQQYTKEDDQEVSSSENKVENVIKMNENELTIAKFHQGDNYQYQDAPYDADDGLAINLVKITDDEFKIKFRDSGNETDRTITINDDYLKLDWQDDTKSITIDDTEISIIQEDTKIVINKDGSVDVEGKEIHIQGKKTEITSDKIILNGETGTGFFYEIFRDFINTNYNSHTHGTPSGPSSPPVAPFTNAAQGKSKNVKLS